MRVISGKARGTKLYSLEGENTRPTLDRVKESLFNIIQNDIQNCSFLDLFSGSGAIGIEAASRGAKEVTISDKSKEACDIMKKNIEKVHMQDNIILYNLDFEQVLNNKINSKQDIIYIDPPYNTGYGIKALEIIIKKELIHENSLVIIETDDEEKNISKIKEMKIEIIDIRKYGRACLIFLKEK